MSRPQMTSLSKSPCPGNLLGLGSYRLAFFTHRMSNYLTRGSKSAVIMRPKTTNDRSSSKTQPSGNQTPTYLENTPRT